MTNYVAIVARELANYGENVDEEYHGGWPTDEEGNPVSHCRVGGHSIDFGEECLPYNGELYFEIEDVYGLPWLGEYGDWEVVTHREYLEFVNSVVGGDVSKLKEYFADGEQRAVKEIAEINKQIAALVNRMVELSDPYGLEVTVDLGDRGTLDLNGPWDSSSAYC